MLLGVVENHGATPWFGFWVLTANPKTLLITVGPT